MASDGDLEKSGRLSKTTGPRGRSTVERRTTKAGDSKNVAFFPRLESEFEKRFLVGDGGNLLVGLARFSCRLARASMSETPSVFT